MGLAATKPSPEAMASAKEIVDAAINGNKVCVFSKSYCPYCTKAKRALQKSLSKFFVMELDGRNDGAAIQDYLASITGGRSVPRVFIAGKFIGGGDDTDALARNGQLEVMLKDAGAL